MKIVIEKPFPRAEEIKKYYEDQNKLTSPFFFIPLDHTFKELTTWFKGTNYIVGRGAHHIWLKHKNNIDERLMIIT